MRLWFDLCLDEQRCSGSRARDLEGVVISGGGGDDDVMRLSKSGLRSACHKLRWPMAAFEFKCLSEVPPSEECEPHDERCRCSILDT